MRKREVLSVEDYARKDASPAPEPSGEEPQATLYCRCPLSLADRLRAMAFERSRGKRKRITQNDLLIEAVERLLNSEGF